MASRYSFEPANLRFLAEPGESMSELTTRANREVIEFTLANPGYVAHFISNHFFNAEINNLMTLPLRDGLVGWKELLIPKLPFWEKWDASPSVPQGILLVVYLALVVFGMAAAWVRAGWAGMVPLLVNLGFQCQLCDCPLFKRSLPPASRLGSLCLYCNCFNRNYCLGFPGVRYTSGSASSHCSHKLHQSPSKARFQGGIGGLRPGWDYASSWLACCRS